jgi:hypothetical protein
VTGNTFATPPTNWPPTRFIGGEYSGYVATDATPLPFVVYDASSWIFKGTGLRDGTQIPDVIRSDIEHVDPPTAPPDLQVLGHSPVPLTSAYTNQGAWNGDTYSDMTYYTDPASNAGIFESGTVSWISRLSICEPSPGPCPATDVARITGNLLRVFGQGPAGRIEPSIANWSSVQPRLLRQTARPAARGARYLPGVRTRRTRRSRSSRTWRRLTGNVSPRTRTALCAPSLQSSSMARSETR